MNVHYRASKANIVVAALSRMIKGSTTHIEDEKMELVNDVQRVSILGVRLVDLTSGGVSVHPSFESSLVVEVKQGQHLNHVLMELKDLVFIKMSESFAFGGDGIHRY